MTSKRSGQAKISTPSRRTVVGGAAWAVPTVALASAAPAAAASPTCPTMPNGAAWSTQAPAFGSLSPNQPGNTTAWVQDGSLFASQRDNASSTAGRTAVVVTSTTIPVTAGTTYTFTFDAAGIWSSGDPNSGGGANAARGRQSVRILVDNADALRISTRPAFDGGQQIPMSAGGGLQWQTYSVTYTATKTKDLPFVFFAELSNRDANHLTNDDVLIQLPVVTCTP